MGVIGFISAGGGSIGVLLGGVLTDLLDWHWIFLVNVPVGVAVYFFSMVLLPASRAQDAERRLDVAGAVAVTASLILAVYAIVNGNAVGWTSARTLGLLGAAAVLAAAFAVVELRVGRAPRAVRPVPLAQPGDGQCRRRAVGRGDVRVVLPGRAVPAGRARLQPAGGRAGVPARQPDHGRVLARAVGEARSAVRAPAAAGRRAGDRRGGPRPARAGAGRRPFRGRRAAQHAAAGPRRGHRLQPRAPRRDERRRAEGRRARLRVSSTPPS